MRRSLNAFLSKIELVALWIVRILFAPDHFGVGFFRRIKYCIHGGFMPDQVAMYDLPHKGTKEYLSEFDWHKSRNINEPYSSLLNNKVVFGQMVERYCPSPEIYAIKHGKRLVGMNGRVINDYADLIPLLHEVKAFVVKPVCAGKGNDIHIVKFNGKGIMLNNQPSSEDEFIACLKRSKEWFVCAYAYQADYLNTIYPSSANTLRMIVLRNNATNRLELCFAVQRIGASWTGAVDNGSKGGLIANVDIETGMLSEARTLHNLTVYETHPDTRAQIKGTVIPNWESLKNDVVRVSNEFPYLDIIAWDILPTAEGFTVIEANTSSGVNIIQLWGPQRNGRLGQFYREHGVIK